MSKVSYYWHWDKEIPHEICQKIINLGEGNWTQAQTVGSREENKIPHYVRKSDIMWVRGQEDQWVYELIWSYMLHANEQAGWKYNIVAVEDCQITRYTKDGFYGWHKDGIGSHNGVYNEPNRKFLHGNTRKLSMIIVLNSDFEGGDFELQSDKEQDTPSCKGGSIIMFPSFLEHRVTPVTKGTRYSLVAWFIGPPFV